MSSRRRGCRTSSRAERRIAPYERVLLDIRGRGYDLGLESDARGRLLRVVTSLQRTPDAQQLREIIDDLLKDMNRGDAAPSTNLSRPTTTHVVQNMTAPTVDRTGNVVIALTIDGFPGPVLTREIRKYADVLLDHAGPVTRAIHGTYPDHWPRPEPVVLALAARR